jgi:hypothetical protein
MPQTWSAYVDVVSGDGARALIVRVSHDPAADRAEIWVHAFIDGRLFGHMSAHPCPSLAASTTGDARQQAVLDLPGGRLSAQVLASETDRTVFGEGPIVLGATLVWATEGHQGSNLRGRDERLVRVDATVTLNGRCINLSGWGHQHTQLQEQPRFAVPFTYLSLRGDEAVLVGLLASNLQRGFGRLRGVALDATALRVGPPAVQRMLEMTTADTRLQGSLTRTYQYWIPMGGGWRDGSIVTGSLDGVPVSGVINDYAGPVG